MFDCISTLDHQSSVPIQFRILKGIFDLLCPKCAQKVGVDEAVPGTVTARCLDKTETGNGF